MAAVDWSVVCLGGRLLWFSMLGATALSCSGVDAQRVTPAPAESPVSASIPHRASPPAEPATRANAATPPEDVPPPPPILPSEPGRADLDPTNDELVAPPDVIFECEALLAAHDAEFSPAKLPLRRTRAGRECGTPQAVAFRGVKGGARYSPTPVLSCGMALALARFEPKLQAAASASLGGRVVRVRHLGTYNCRDMARFDLVSEHSYANAIDVSEIVLDSGRTVSVLRHFGRPSGEPRGPEGRFLRELSQRAFDDGDFSCVITEFFDPLHRDHIHLDLARYRVDGTR